MKQVYLIGINLGKKKMFAKSENSLFYKRAKHLPQLSRKALHWTKPEQRTMLSLLPRDKKLKHSSDRMLCMCIILAAS